MPAALLQEEPDLTFLPDVPTTAYKPKSADLITMLEGLQGKFRTKVEDLDKEEAGLGILSAPEVAIWAAGSEMSGVGRKAKRRAFLQEARLLDRGHALHDIERFRISSNLHRSVGFPALGQVPGIQ